MTQMNSKFNNNLMRIKKILKDQDQDHKNPLIKEEKRRNKRNKNH